MPRNEYKGLLDDISKGEQENARRFSLDEDVKRIDTDIAHLEWNILKKRQERLGKVSLRGSIKVVDETGLKDRMTEPAETERSYQRCREADYRAEIICWRSGRIGAARYNCTDSFCGCSGAVDELN